jgi:ankyrin repeat protein
MHIFILGHKLISFQHSFIAQMAVVLNLVPHGRTFDLSKDFILEQMPESPLAQALNYDPDATSIEIPNTDVTPDAMQDIVNLSQGIEPTRHNPDLTLAERYLNIPWVLNYTDPLYDQIQRDNIASPANIEVFRKAIYGGQFWVVSYLLSKGCDPTFDNNWAVYWASGRPNTEIVRLLLADSRVNPATDKNRALENAIRQGPLETVKLLLVDSRVNPSANNNKALKIAAELGRVDVVIFLLADPKVTSTKGLQKAFREAAKYGHVDVVKIFLGVPKINPLNTLLLWNVAQMGQTEVLRVLLADPRLLKFDRNDHVDRYEAALIMAATCGHTEIVRMLMAIPGVNPAAFRNEAIYAATRGDHLATVKLLLTDERVDPQGGLGNSFNEAIRRENLEMVELLLADPRVHPEIKCNEALTLAAKYGFGPIVELLLADVQVRATPISNALADWIQRNPDQPTTQLIRKCFSV